MNRKPKRFSQLATGSLNGKRCMSLLVPRDRQEISPFPLFTPVLFLNRHAQEREKDAAASGSISHVWFAKTFNE
jgi:hypothetical protein